MLVFAAYGAMRGSYDARESQIRDMRVAQCRQLFGDGQ